jgi:hypothetical protein
VSAGVVCMGVRENVHIYARLWMVKEADGSMRLGFQLCDILPIDHEAPRTETSP